MSLEMQMQMRRNVGDMHEAVADLSSWASEISKKDRTLRGVDVSQSASTEAEALRRAEEEEEEREIAAAKEELRRLAEAEQQDEPPLPPTGAAGAAAAAKKGGSTKYDKWDRYDAESVIKQLEDREADKERLRLEVARLENRRAQAQVRKKHEADATAAEALRQAGNDAFAAARYEEATERYTSALDLTPRSAVLYANRALALLKLGAAAEAEEDCNAALMIEPAYIKARLRRAQARRSLFNYDGALEDIEAALEVEPKNAAARKQMQECRQLRGHASAARPAVVQRALEIAQVAHDPANDGNGFVAVVAPAAQPSLAAPAPAPAATAVATGDADADADADAVAVPPPAAAAAPRVPPSPGAAAFGVPGSAADVERAWRSLRRQPAEWVAYARSLEPSLLSALFRHSLPAELLSAFLAAADACADTGAAGAAHALATLRALSGAGRFAILTMCMDKADAAAAASVFAKLQAAHGRGELPEADDLAAVRAKYA